MADFDSKKEKAKLNKIIKNLPEDKRKICDGLIADASFMAEQLEKLRAHIDLYGWSEEYQNGEHQKGRKASVEAGFYVKLQNNYAKIIAQLTGFLPDGKADTVAKAGEALAGFIAKGKPEIR